MRESNNKHLVYEIHNTPITIETTQLASSCCGDSKYQSQICSITTYDNILAGAVLLEHACTHRGAMKRGYSLTQHRKIY